MSRSRKKVCKHKCGGSHTEKQHKKMIHRIFRRAEKQAIFNEEDPPEDLKPFSVDHDAFSKSYIPEDCWYYPPSNESLEEQQARHDKWRERVLRK